MAASNLRFGAHATSEVGQDLQQMIAQLPASQRSEAKIGVFTDPNVAQLPLMQVVEDSLQRAGLSYTLWDKCAVEPTDLSWQVSQF
jgi:hydroxyacid-oxoacid transhydrogenase